MKSASIALKLLLASFCLLAPYAVGPLIAKKRVLTAWDVTSSVDPITGVSSCVVAAVDKIAYGKSNLFKYSVSGYLYPFVEKNSRFGLLIGVSSGGRIRMPIGNVLWRVDDKPHRTLLASDNAAPDSAGFSFMPPATGNKEVDATVANSMAAAQKMIAATLMTSTAATGPKAAEMLNEMLAGHALLFRRADAAPQYGLPSSSTYAVGQFTTWEGHRAIPFDESFRAGLLQCGIKAESNFSSSPSDTP